MFFFVVNNLKTANGITSISSVQVGDLIHINEQKLLTYYNSQNKITAVDNSAKTINTLDNSLLDKNEEIIFFIRKD